ncbi:FhaA domain-containing protein [Thermanaeromonas sp. C210]|uniref:FhaA domain-containing protein n=1 Tax=Thermanaeromonas sp. C210 TaxID=2731925 RepID=UPI00155C609B|nr:DUF3662 and FHA domain-containing protein [Thermanaeromonas sp. C210]GFN24014.1 phosphopeptide-binding protein [Thermanaeromonas sp. C210]
MNWLERAETFWRRVFEGIFQRGEGSPLQPVEVAKRLVQVMRDNRSVSVNRVYVPNIYLVYLSPRDYENLSMYKNALAEELAEYLRDQVEARSYTLVGEIRVEWEIDEELPPGEMRVHARLEEGRPEKPSEDTLVYLGQTDKGLRENTAGELRLVVVEGPDKGRSFVLHPGKQILGRNPTCELLLTDEQVSRQHCQITIEDNQGILTDLGSRNGTLVNGKPVQRALLAPGDRIQVGRTVLEVQVV